MLFFDYKFLFLFMPLSFAGYLYSLSYQKGFIAAWLACVSLIFYSLWDVTNLYPLGVSILLNYIFGIGLARLERGAKHKSLFVGALLFNLSLLGFYKYGPLLNNLLNPESFFHEAPVAVAIPLGISFFTFTQIAFLVDTFSGKSREYDLINYILFVTYFPHLIAGPIIHHKEMMPQFKDLALKKFQWENLSLGITLFMIGLFKKVIVADYFVTSVQALFERSSQGSVSFLDAWIGTFSYTLQIYFDFSGYSDMALGLSKMFGIRLPINFNSPYKATSIIDFWRRWHITLSRFLRDYIYIPLGGNRHGHWRRYLNLFVTMFIGGLWHGAGWTFIVWGSLHGILLGLNNILILIRKLLPFQTPGEPLVNQLKKLMTFILVSLLWVPFRAMDLQHTIDIWKGCLGMNGFFFPEVWAQKLSVLVPIIEGLGFVIEASAPTFSFTSVPILFFFMLIVLYAPNSLQLLGDRRNEVAIIEGYADMKPTLHTWMIWKQTKFWAVAMVLISIIALWCRYETSEFLYFQF